MNLTDVVSGPAALTVAVSTMITALFVLVPPLKSWFTSLEADGQIALRGFAVLVLAIVLTAGSCVGWLSGLACTRDTVFDFFARVVLGAVLGMAGSNAVFESARVARSAVRNVKPRSFELPRAQRAKLLE